MLALLDQESEMCCFHLDENDFDLAQMSPAMSSVERNADLLSSFLFSDENNKEATIACEQKLQLRRQSAFQMKRLVMRHGMTFACWVSIGYEGLKQSV